MTDKSVFPHNHEPHATKRKSHEGQSELSSGRKRGKAMSDEAREMEGRAKGHDHHAGGPGAEGQTEISEPHDERGLQRGYGKNQDDEQERKTNRGRANGGRF